MERHFLMISRALNARKRKIFALFFALAASIGLSYALTPKGTDVWDDATKTLTVNSNPQDDYYNDQGEIKRLVISSSVTEIGEQAFSSNYNLQEVIAYDGLQVIDQSAFFSCPNLESVILPSTLREVRYSAFAYCDNLKYVTINAPSLEDYAEYAFDDTHTDLKIYVPAESVATYKTNWSAYADRIEAIGGGSAPATTVVTITNNDFPGMDVSFTKDGVTVSADWIDNMQSGNLVAPGSFSTTLGNFTKIEVNAGEIGSLGEGWSGNSERQTWTGNASSVSFSGDISGLGHGITLKFTIEAAAPARDPQRFADTVTVDLVVGDTLAMGAYLSSEKFSHFYCATNRVRFHGTIQTSDYYVPVMEFVELGAFSKHGAIDRETVESPRGCIEPINENGELAEEWIVTSTNPFTIAGIGKAEITNHSYRSEVDYAALEPGDTIAFGASIVNTPEKVWFLGNRMYRNIGDESGILQDDSKMNNSYGTFGKNGVLTNQSGYTFSPINEQGTLGGKWVVVFYSPLTIAGIGYPLSTLTLSDKVSILGMPVAGITDLGNNNYEVEPGTQFQIQAAAAPEHYNFVGWSDLASTDPNYSANPRTITINSDSTIKPLYALETFTITLTSNDTTMGKVTLRAGSGGGEDGDMSIANNADLEGANTSRNIAVGADGSIHVVYKSTEDQSVKYIKSIDGVTFTEPVTVANGAKECEVAVSSNGKVYVSYYKENDGAYIAYSADGTSFTSVRVDNNASSIHLATDGDYVYGVNMAGTKFYYSSNGGQTYDMHFDWNGYMFSDVMVDPLNHNVVVIKDEPNVVVRYSTDHGATFTEEAPVMVQGGNDQLAIFFSTATMGDGKVYMAGADAFVAIIDYKTATCTKTDVNSTDNRSLCADPVGNVIVGVEQNENLYYQLSTNSAVSFGDKVLVSNGSGANAALNYHDGTLLYLFTKDNKLYLATRTGIVPTESVVDNGDGTYAVQYGTEVTFTAKAKPGYHVESWSNAVEVNDNIVATQTLEVNSAMTIGATFAANPILTIATNDSTKGIVSLEGAGAGEPTTVTWNNSDMPSYGSSYTKDGVTLTCTISDSDMYGPGTFTTDLGNFTQIVVSAPAACYIEATGGWSGNNDQKTWTGNASSVSFSGNIYGFSTDVTFVFTIEPAAPAAEGIIDLGGGQYSVVPGTELTFVAKPAEEHYLVSWNGEAATSDTLKLTMNGELAVNASFAHVPYMITLPEGVSIVAPVPAGITDKGNGVYEIVEGTEFQISADIIPEHYHFDHWADLADSVAQYSANPRTIVAGENLTVEPIFAIDTYTLTLATNDSTKGVVSVIGAGSGAGASVGEMIDLSEKQSENPVMGEYFQVAGEGVNYQGRIIGQSNDYQLTISSQNGEKLDFIILEVSSKGLWSGYTVSSTAGDVEDLLDNFTIRVSNINATSVTISRSGTTANPTGYIIVSSVYVNEEIPLSVGITDHDFPNSGNVLTGNGVTLTAGSFDLVTPQIVGGGTFTTDLGNFTKIEIYAMSFSEFSGEGWTEEGDYKRVWTGNASSVSFGGAVIGEEKGSIYIAYTIAPASAASGIVDNGDGTYTVDYGTELTFVAKPAEGFMLESWSNGAAVTGDTLKLTMTEELSLTANFKHIPATITLPEGVSIVEPMPAGITSKGEGVYEVEYGTEFQISADSIPAHHHFGHWADLADSVAQYSANPRTIVAGENLTVEPIYAIDTYTVALASNDTTMGTLRVEGAGGSNIGPREELNLGTDYPAGEHYQVLGEFSGPSWIGVGDIDNNTITVESLNGEIIDNITLEVYMPLHWTGYSIAATSGEVSGDVASYQDLVITNINATSVTLSRVGEGENGGSVLFSEIIVNGRDEQQGGQAEPITVTITNQDFPSEGNSFTKDGVTVSAETMSANYIAYGTFSTTLGNITRIQVTSDARDASGDGWVGSGKTWVGNASSVPFSGYFSDMYGVVGIKFVITIEPTAAPAAATGIVDNGDGTYTVDWGTEMSIIAEPKEGYMLASWNGEPALSDTLKQTVEGALSVNATFKHIPAVITLPEGVSIVGMPIEGITSKGEGVYEVEYGTAFQISADGAPEHYHFGHWADLADTTAMYAANPRTIVAAANLTVEPIYAIDTYTLTLATNDSTKGIVSVIGAGGEGEEPSAQLIVPESWSSEVGVTITAADLPGFVASTEEAVKAMPVPTEGSVFVIYNFKDDGGVEAVTFENGEYVRTTSTSVDRANTSYYSNQGMIFLYTTAAGQGGQGGEGGEGIVDNGDGTYTVDWGTELTFVAKAADGYHVESWSNGAEVNDLVEATQTITMTEALDLSALFAENPIITLATNDSTMGIVTLAGAGNKLTVAGSNMDVNQNVPIRTVSSTDTRTMSQSIYPAALLSGIAGDSISGMTYYISEPGAHVLTATYVVKLMETEQAAFSDAVAVNTESATTVYTGTIDVTGNTLDIVFDQPYAYNGGNLLVEFSISSASHQNALAKFSVFASQGGSFQQYYNLGFEEMRYYTYDFLAKTTFICGDNKGIPGVIDLGNGQYNVLPGTELTFEAVPAKDYHLVSWSNGAEVTEDNKQTLTVTDGLSLSAFFKHDTYILTVEGAEVETAKFADGTIDAVVLNPGTLVGVVEGDSVKLTTTATYSSANVGEDLTITLHYAIEVVEDGIYDNEYALAITDSIYPIKGAIIEPMTPDEEKTPEEQEMDNKEGFEIYAYGYCRGDQVGFRFHLNSGNPDQYKIDFADSRFTDIDWTDLEVSGKDGEVFIDIPVDMPTGDYQMTVTFRDSRYTWLESNPLPVTFHVNLPETYVVALFDNVMAVVDTCECLTDIQWYWRADATQPWTLIEGATGYYYKQEGGLSGEYFIKAKMNGVETYTCPQDDMTLYGDTKQAKVSAYPNPVLNTTTVTIENSRAWNHTIRIVNLMGNEMMTGSFEGNETTVDMSGYSIGNYMISVDGIVVKVMKQ